MKKSNITKPRFRRNGSAIKVLSFILLFSISLGYYGMGASSVISYTHAFYSDIEKSSENTFLSGELDFELWSTSFTPTTTPVSLSSNEIFTKYVTVLPNGSNPFKYIASTTNIYGDTDYCAIFNLSATLEGYKMYDGNIFDVFTEATTTLDSWIFEVEGGAQEYQNSICSFDIEYLGSQERHGYALGGGYSDAEILKNDISSWGFRINKVYYDVAKDKGEEGVNEWIEIFNQTNIDLDIDGWEICDNSSCDLLSASEFIPANGYGFLSASSTTATSTFPAYWYLPDEVVEITIVDQKIGDGLHNENDVLILKRPDGLIVDQMNWGVPSEGWNNYNSNLWNPGSVDVEEGNALMRIPNGYDTNDPSDFVDIATSSLDLIYPDENESYIWYWGSTYKIEWSAINNNGSDNELGIHIFYVKDTNLDEIRNDGDDMIEIVKDTVNDGEFEWTVPSGFIGYIWIYLVAEWDQNPMWSSNVVSGDIFDPIPMYVGPDGIEAVFDEDVQDTQLLIQSLINDYESTSNTPQFDLRSSSTTFEAITSDVLTTNDASSTTEMLPNESSTSTLEVINEVIGNSNEQIIAEEATTTPLVLVNATTTTIVATSTTNLTSADISATSSIDTVVSNNTEAPDKSDSNEDGVDIVSEEIIAIKKDEIQEEEILDESDLPEVPKSEEEAIEIVVSEELDVVDFEIPATEEVVLVEVKTVTATPTEVIPDSIQIDVIDENA